ncbi:MAG TPA: HD domain-containing protein [Methanomassiliicoccales archaeon]|jgi:metal-dependent HD superfamily phosphatase/phosphodiesterase|nr:HD domain-containing protein [Methanomassiliicoccales archaeon]
MAFEVPVQGNARLSTILERMNSDEEVKALWKASNINAIDRLGFSDHGSTHVRIVARNALKMLRLLMEAGHQPGVVRNYALTKEDAEIVVVLASAMHDIGLSVHREDHDEFSIMLSPPILRRLLKGLYEEPNLTFMVAETQHAMISHHEGFVPYTIEGGVVRVADALDMEKGRARIPFASGSINIHSVSALAIDKVRVGKGHERPIQIDILMNNSAGIFQVDELLKEKIARSGLRDLITVEVKVPEAERGIVKGLRL